MAKYLYGLSAVKFGTPTNAATMPAELDAFAQTSKGSFTFEETEATVEKFYTEESASPVKVITTADPSLEISWKTYDYTPAMIEIVKGGDGHTLATKFQAPAGTVNIEKAMQIETTAGITFHIYKANIVARLTGKLSKDGLSELEIKATALAPAEGLSAWDYTVPA